MSDSFSFVKVVTESTDDLINNLFRAGEIAQWLGYILFLQRMGFQLSALMTGSSQPFVTPAPGGSAASDCEGRTQAQFIVVKIFLKLAFVFLKKMIGFVLKILIIMLSLLSGRELRQLVLAYVYQFFSIISHMCLMSIKS